MPTILEGQSSAQSFEVRPLHCAQCGAAVAPGDGSFAECTYCGARTAVPASHLSAQRLKRGARDTNELARVLLKKLGPKPWWLREGAGADVAKVPASQFMLLGVTLPLVSWFLGIVVDIIVCRVLWLRGVKDWQRPQPQLLVMPVAAGVVLLIAFVIVYVRNAKMRHALRRETRAGLAAAPPFRTGGPSLCRGCGAALEVIPDTTSVQCAYCGVDNLVLRSAWIAKAAEQEGRTLAHLDDAFDALQRNSYAARVHLISLLITALCGGAAVLLMASWLDGNAQR